MVTGSTANATRSKLGSPALAVENATNQTTMASRAAEAPHVARSTALSKAVISLVNLPNPRCQFAGLQKLMVYMNGKQLVTKPMELLTKPPQIKSLLCVQAYLTSL